MRTGTHILAAAFCAATVIPVAAQPARPDESHVYGLELKTSPDIATGKIAMVQGEVGAEPDRFLVENLTILQPVQVLVVTKDPADAVQVRICKFLWDQPEREASTKGTGAVRLAFRTEGDFRIQVSSPGGAHAYQLVVWAGDAASPPVQPAFVSMEQYRAQHGSGGSAGLIGASPAVWVIAGALVVIAGFLGVLVMKKGRA